MGHMTADLKAELWEYNWVEQRVDLRAAQKDLRKVDAKVVKWDCQLADTLAEKKVGLWAGGKAELLVDDLVAELVFLKVAMLVVVKAVLMVEGKVEHLAALLVEHLADWMVAWMADRRVDNWVET